MIGTLDSTERYGRYLRGLAAFRAAVEPALGEKGAPGDWMPQPIALLLAADMSDLNLDPAPRLPVAAPACPSQRLGFSYVLEGSALGAQILRRQARALGFDAGHGARHLAAQTTQPERWRGFCRHLEAATPFDDMAAAAAADEAFALARRAMEAVDAV